MAGLGTGFVDRVASAPRRLVAAEELEAEVVQAAFALVFLLEIGLRSIGGSPPALGSWPMVGALVVALACVAALLVSWERAPVWALGLLPVLDIVALGFSRLHDAGGATGLLAMVPALWLGRLYGVRGALTAFASAGLFLAVPGLTYLGASGANLARSVLIPIVAFWVAIAVSSALERVRASRDAAETGRRELEQALATIEEERRFSDAILDTVDVGLVLLDPDGTYRATNRRHHMFMRLAYPEGHAGRAGQVGLVFGEDGVTPLTSEQTPSYLASRGEEFDDLLLWIGGDPLTNRAVKASARSVRDENGDFAGAALAYTDVTDFVRALRVKDEFVASVSHELRTPLTSIVGYVSILLERDDLPPDVVSQLEVVGRNTGRLNRLVADLLQTARTDEGPMPVVRRETDLAAIARHCLEAVGPAARRAGVELELDAPESLVVLADHERMAQVVDNLVSNAVKYTADGGHVRVSLGVDGNRVELRVADTGIGISAADRDHLFTRFFRTRQAAERSIQGVGLGLSITRSIVESHGGRIEVDSELGRGSEFRVRLPI